MGIGMKSILTIIIILMGTFTYGQSHNAKYEMVNDNLVKKTTYMNGRVDQIGYYIVINNNMMKHGEWKLYHNGRVLSKAKFDKGNLVWIDTNGGRITSDQIKVRKLEHRVEQLERILITYKN